MAFKEVWQDFERLEHKEEPSMQGTSRTELFACWQCPHCPAVVRVLANASARRRKGDACAAHFWNRTRPCPKRPVGDVRGKPKPKKPALPMPALAPAVCVSIDPGLQALHEELARLREEGARYNEQSTRRHARLMEALGVSDHSSDDECGVKKLKRKLDTTADTATTVAYATVAQAGSYSPQRDGEPPVVFGRRVAARVQTDMKEAATAGAMRAHCVRINERLDLPPTAVPAQSIESIQGLKDSVATHSATEARLRRERNTLKGVVKTERDANGSLESVIERMIVDR